MHICVPSCAVGHQGAIANSVVAERRPAGVRIFSTGQLADGIIRKARAVAAGVNSQRLLSGCIIGIRRPAIQRIDQLRLSAC